MVGLRWVKVVVVQSGGRVVLWWLEEREVSLERDGVSLERERVLKSDRRERECYP